MVWRKCFEGWRLLYAAMLGMLAPFAGCQHAPEVINSDDFVVQRIEDASHRKLRVALIGRPEVDWGTPEFKTVRRVFYGFWERRMGKPFYPCGTRFLRKVAESLSDQAGYEVEVVDNPVDIKGYDAQVCLGIKTKSDRARSVKNGFIAFPGCMIFAHGWYGFSYDIELVFKAVVLNPEDGTTSESPELDRKLDLRYTNPGPGSVASAFYLVPLGTIAAIWNIAQVTGDKSSGVGFWTNDLLDPLVDGLAQEIIRGVNNGTALPGASARTQGSRTHTTWTTLSNQHKALDDMKAAEIIDEAEFAAEMKKLEGEGK